MIKVKDSVSREIIVKAAIQKVWDALTKEEHLNRWYTKEAKVDFRIGGKGFLNHGWGATSEGIYTEIEPLKRFVMQSQDGDFQTITELEEVDNGIRVRITYHAPFINEMDAVAKENMLFGTGQFLGNLKSVYEANQDQRNRFWRVWIGISHSSNEEIPGTKVQAVKEGTSADKAGLLPGDIIIKMDQDRVTGYQSFEQLLNAKDSSSTVTLTILRGKEEVSMECPLDAYPVPY
ncbi:SRPBCC domain-containing protein [Ornithinibacillus halotolerans]|uniref:PDZ domain-containing protein n=1 Tax=Ornithinibacillus halotolerans TaxID=1274357 RepID=A0A916S628_9BACI|nr:SRPBCC domain-containing protein [Ornithinibacillus halotolerans]GGA85177.1 hypothetical protein GCM10008025_30270 [Ornithinibacillus halotolerans]